MLLSNGGKISVMSCMQTFQSECLILFSPSNLKWYTECQRLFLIMINVKAFKTALLSYND